jgi:hypothetical protein
VVLYIYIYIYNLCVSVPLINIDYQCVSDCCLTLTLVWVKPKTIILVFVASPLSTQH